MRKFTIALSFCLLMSAVGRSAPQYAIPRGARQVSNGSVYSICQDGTGAVWMNTNYGLCRLNGNRMDYVRGRLPRGRISYDSSGHIYIPGFDGIIKVGTEDCKMVLLKGDGLKYPGSVVLSSPGRLYVAEAEKIYSGSVADTLILECRLPEGETVTDLEYSTGGKILASTASGNLYDVSELKSPLCVYSSPSAVSTIFTDSRQRIWLGLENGGICVLDNDYFLLKRYLSAGERPVRNARSFCEDASGSVYVGSLDGLYIVSPDGKFTYSDEYCPAGHAVCQVVTDRDNNVWIGTFYDGVFLCEADNSPFRTVPNPDLRLINAMIEDRSGCVWIFTDNCGLWKYIDGKGFSMVPGTLDKKFKSAWYDSRENAIWAGDYFAEIDRIDPASGRLKRYPCESGVFDIAGRRGLLYMATAGGVYVLNPSDETLPPRFIEGTSGHVNSVLFDADGTLWIAGNKMMRYTPSEGVETVPDGGNCINLSCGHDGSIYACMAGKGLYVYKDGFRKIFDNAGTGLQDNYVYMAEEISDGVALVGTDMGLSLLDTGSGRCCNYNSSNGLGLTSTREGCILHRSGGEIWIGGVDGLVCLDRESISLPVRKASVSFEMVIIDDRPDAKPLWVGGKDRVVLPPGRQRGVIVELSDFNYSGILPSSYEYRVCGADSGWLPLDSKQKITFHELSPGRYTIEVRSSISGDASVSRLKIEVPRKWYASFAAVICYILLAGTGVFLALRARMARRRRELEIRERRRAVDSVVEMAETMHTARSRGDKDSEFLMSVASVIEKHLSDEKFGVEMLCSELHISRTMLDRRIKSITGNSPRAFIEDIRLTMAAKLVKAGDMNVSEIAYEMGYSSPKYFSIRFKNKFGVSPLSYRNTK